MVSVLIITQVITVAITVEIEMYTLETHHTQTVNGYIKPITVTTEFYSKQQVDEHLFIYKLAENIGYTLYDISEQQYWDDYDNRYKHIVEQWFDKTAFRGVYNAKRPTKKN